MLRAAINHPVRTAVLISAVYFLIHLFLMKDYGISWDFHYHHYAGLYHIGLPVPAISDKAPVPFSPPDPRLTTQDPFGPFTQILPTLSYLFFYERLHLLPFDASYNLPMVLFGSLGIGLLFLVVYEMFGALPAWLGALFLALFPVHVAYLHTDMKDVPNAFAFALSLYLFWRLVHRGGWGRLAAAVVSFAIAFNIKINSILIPVVCTGYCLWYLMLHRLKRLKWMILYAFCAPLAAGALWWPFWEEPWDKLMELPVFYSQNTLNMPVLFFGTIYRSGVNIPWYYPFGYIAVTTPLPILVGFLIGFIVLVRKLFQRDDRSALLLLWFFVPIARYMTPHTGAIDGVRHFLEIVYPLCAIAAVGWATIILYVTGPAFSVGWRIRRASLPDVLFRAVPLAARRAKWGHPLSLIRYTVAFLGIIMLSSLIWNNIKFHPYQASFFNSLIGGIRGAQGNLDIDFWGTPQKEAVAWINTHAPPDASVHIVMGQSSAAMYLRSDLLAAANSTSKEESDYTVLLNRESFFGLYTARPYLEDAQRNNRIVFTRSIDGVPLVWVIKNGADL